MNSAEVKMTWGRNYSAYKVVGSADLDPDGNWNADLSFSRVRFDDPEASGWSDWYFLELNYFLPASFSFSGNFSYSLDNNQVLAAGPGVSLFYTYFAPLPAAPGQHPPETLFPSDVFTLGFDIPVLFYQAEVDAAVSQSGGYDATDGKIRLTQLAPTVFLDVSLLPGLVNVTASGSCFLYSDDPSQIASLVSPALSSASAAALDSLMAGLLWSSWHAGAYLSLPLKLQFGVNYGRQKQVYPEEWVDSYDLNLSGRIFTFLKAKVGWKRFTSSVGASDLYTAALRFDF